MELVAPECDGRTPGVVCGADGCFRDRYGYVWYCFSQIDDDPINQRCWITFSFGEPQDLHSVYITLFGGTENTKTLTFFLDGGVHGEIETSDGPIEYLLDAENVSEVKIYADHDASVTGMASVIDEVRRGGSSTRCTLGREHIDA